MPAVCTLYHFTKCSSVFWSCSTDVSNFPSFVKIALSLKSTAGWVVPAGPSLKSTVGWAVPAGRDAGQCWLNGPVCCCLLCLPLQPHSLGNKLRLEQAEGRAIQCALCSPVEVTWKLQYNPRLSYLFRIAIYLFITTGTRKMTKLFFLEDLSNMWIYSFIWRAVYVCRWLHTGHERQCCADTESPHSRGHAGRPSWGDEACKLNPWRQWFELAIPWLRLFLPLGTVKLFKITALVEQKLNLITYSVLAKKKKNLRRRRNFSKEWWLETTPVRTVSQSTANNKWEEVKQQKGHVRLSGCNWFCYFFV